MAAMGVRNSWLALATKSVFICDGAGKRADIPQHQQRPPARGAGGDGLIGAALAVADQGEFRG